MTLITIKVTFVEFLSPLIPPLNFQETTKVASHDLCYVISIKSPGCCLVRRR